MHHILTVNVLYVSFLIGSVIPLLTGLVAKAHASSSVKSVVNLVLSAVAGAGAYVVQHNGTFSGAELGAYMFTTYIASGVLYNHLWKPSGVAAGVQNLLPDVGLGGSA